MLSRDPAVHHVQAQQRPDDDPPRLSARRSVFGGNVLFAVRAPLGVFVNLPFAIGAGHRFRLVVVARIVLPFVADGSALRHERSPLVNACRSSLSRPIVQFVPNPLNSFISFRFVICFQIRSPAPPPKSPKRKTNPASRLSPCRNTRPLRVLLLRPPAVEVELI